MVKVARCSCGVCVYCVNRARYFREFDLRRRRSHLRVLALRERREEVRGLISDFNSGLISYDDFLRGLDVDE